MSLLSRNGIHCHSVYFTNILTLTDDSIKRPVSNDKCSLTYFRLTTLIYLTIMLICCVLTTIVLPINENSQNTIQFSLFMTPIHSLLFQKITQAPDLSLVLKDL